MPKSKRPVTACDLTKLEIYSDPQFTPDGQAYAFVSTTVNEKKEYESHLFFQKLNDSAPNKWTFSKGRDSHPRFSPDGSQIVFQSNRSGKSQIWLLHADGGEAKQITTFKNGAMKPNWSKDGKYIIFTASLEKDDDIHDQKELSIEEAKKKREEESKQPLLVNQLKYKSDAKGFHDKTRDQIILLHVENETLTQLTTADADHAYQDISPDGKHILFTANLNKEADFEQTSDLFTLDLTTKAITKLTDGKGSYGNAHFSPSGELIACFGHDYHYKSATLTELFLFDLTTKERTCLSTNWDVHLGDAMIGDMRLGESTTGPVWSKHEDRLYFLGTDVGSTNLYQVAIEQGEMEIIYSDNNQVFGFSYHAESDSLILGISTPTNPCNFHILNNDGKLTQLTNANKAWLEEVQLIEPETVSITAKDGLKIQGWLLRPFGFEEDKKYPFILEIHGGPHAMYGQSFFHEMQLLAAKGYVVLFTNPRGSHGYGQRFVDAVRSDYGGNDFSDLMSAVDYALENYSFIDENRLGVTGGSYGGFMTNWIVGHTNRFKAAVTQRSISNWVSFFGVSDIGHFFTEWELGVSLLDDPAKLWDFSPLKYVKDVETPLLILHGELDYRCPIEQGEQLFIALKQLRKEVEFVRFPHANHELSRSGDPTLRMERLNHICRWFEKYL